MTKPNLRDPEQWIPRELFAAYCGPKSDKLLAYYDKARTKRQMIVMDLDWFAILVLPAWLGYRRQWALWGTLVGTITAIGVLELTLKMSIPNGAFGGALLALGAMGHGLLLSSAQSLYMKLKQQGLQDDGLRAALQDRAAPSAKFAWLALFGALAIGTIFALLAPSAPPAPY